MYPAVRPGDILTVECRDVAEATIGQVAAFLWAGRIVVHRVVGRGADGRGPFLLTRGDMALGGNDGPLYREDLIGVVSEIERGARALEVPALERRTAVRAWHVILGRVVDLRVAVGPGIIAALLRSPVAALYRSLATRWHANALRKLELVAVLPFWSNNGGGHRVVGEQLSELRIGPGGENVTDWSLLLEHQGHAASTLKLAGWPGRDSVRRWCVDAVSTRVRYRGLGLEDVLVERAALILARSGATLDNRSLMPIVAASGVGAAIPGVGTLKAPQ